MFKNNPYYHKSIRNAVIAFGNLFSGIHLVDYESTGKAIRNVEVPISFARKQQWLQRIQGDPEFLKKFEAELPRISFDIISMEYQAGKKIGNHFDHMLINCGVPKTVGSPAPWRLTFELSAYCKTVDDSLQIKEQILPYFTPSLTLNYLLLPEYNFSMDVPVTLLSITDEDNYDDLHSNRRIIDTYTFAMDVQLFGPTSNNVGVIKETIANINTMDGTPMETNNSVVVPRTANKTDAYTIAANWTIL